MTVIKTINAGGVVPRGVFKDQTAFTSDPVYVPASSDMWVGVTGAGPVYIDVQGTDGTWRTYPELTFQGTTAQIVTLRGGYVRFRFAAPTATTLEFSL